MTPKIIFLNGPPRAGKDTAANFIRGNVLDSFQYKQTRPMDRAIPLLFNISSSRWAELREKCKDKPSKELFGMTPRAVLISLSEAWLKPTFGQDVFGRLAVAQLKDVWLDDNEIDTDFPPLTIVSDSGFLAEATPLVEVYKPENCLLFRIHRQRFDKSEYEFTDSRGWVDLSGLGVLSIDILNKDGQQEFFLRELWDALSASGFVNGYANQ